MSLFPVSVDGSILVAILSVIAALGAWITAYVKLKPDIARITVSAAEGAVIVQTSVITSLEGEIERLQGERKALQAAVQVCHENAQELRDVIDIITDRKKLRRIEDAELDRSQPPREAP